MLDNQIVELSYTGNVKLYLYKMRVTNIVVFADYAQGIVIFNNRQIVVTVSKTAKKWTGKAD